MNQHLHSTTKLTEFARDFENEPETLIGRFVNKIQNAYNQSYNTVNDVPGTTQLPKSTFYASPDRSGAEVQTPQTGHDAPNLSVSVLRAGSSEPNSTSSSVTTATTASAEEISEAVDKVDELPMEQTAEGRSMVNVLKRISNIMATKNSDLRNYKDTELQRFWMPDSKAKECYDCAHKFSTFRRKHHCRLCGQIFCSKCCNQEVPGKIIKCSGNLKVCNYCSKIVLSYLKSPDISVDLQADLQALQQDLSSKLEDNGDNANAHKSPLHASQSRELNVGYQEERFAIHQSNISIDDRKNILQQSNSLITLHDEMQRALPLQSSGYDLIDFLNANRKSSNKMQAVAILGAMLAAGFLQPIVPDSEQTDFDENLHYKLVDLPRRQTLDNNADYAVGQAQSLDESASGQFVGSDEPQRPKTIDASLYGQTVQDIDMMESSMRSTTTTSKLLESYCEHEEQLLAQMLCTFGLDARWSKVLMPLCCRAANHFKPEYCTNDLIDVRNYVNFKKVPGGNRQECIIVGGVGFSKNVAHKDMATRVTSPRILLVQCPIVYERVEGKFVSISTVLLQEKQYLNNVCARIMGFRPNVVLVQKNVAGLAQEMLRSQGVTLVLDVKPSVMERLARSLQCDILTSIESNIAKPRLGICDIFYIRSFGDGSGAYKTLMFCEKLTNPRGYTCLLRGGNNAELAKVKRVASFLVYARYNWRLEMSFLLDEYAQHLTPKPPIFDSKEPSPKEEEQQQQQQQQQPHDDSSDDKKPPLCSPITKLERKSDDKMTAVAQNVPDFTDPLRSAELTGSSLLSPDGSSIVELAVETRYDNRFRNALSSTLLSVSPFLTFPLPYLETEQGRKCVLRPLFPPELYFSKLWSSGNNNNNSLERQESADAKALKAFEEAHQHELKLNPPHPFLRLKITEPVDNRQIQTLLAEFRANGGRYPKRKRMFKLSKRKESYQQPQKVSDDQMYRDALDLENHQRLPVLFCSFYLNPKAASSFCAPPTLLDMKFYGQHDIMLGQFLQRYCCPLNPICTLCNLPMLSHVRRFVHSMGCVQVYLAEDHVNEPNHIYFTAWCSICNEMTPKVLLSETAKCMSFAKYLELRFHGHAYKKRPPDDSEGEAHASPRAAKCQHSLHRDYVHYFSFRGVGAKFQYTPIEVWEIGLPPLTLTLQPPKACDQFQVLEEIKNFSLKGHEVYTRIHERIADLAIEDDCSPLVANLKATLSKDQFIFKQHVEIVQTLLTMTKANAYDIGDALLMAKRVLAESIELWGPRLHEMSAAQKLAAKQQQQQLDHTDAGTICTEDLRNEYADVSPTAPDTPRLPPLSTPAAEDHGDDVEAGLLAAIEKKSSSEQLLSCNTPVTSTSSDKKSIKKMLIHLLPSAEPVNLLPSPFVPLEHYTLPLGAIPMLVHDQDLSSVIAYSLTSCDYQRLVANLDKFPQTTNADSCSGGGVTPSPNLKRKSQEAAYDNGGDDKDAQFASPNPAAGSAGNNNNSEEERPKSKTSDSHIEITFQDNLTQFACRMYFAKEFDAMRAKTLQTPKLGKSLYKELEHSKKREELRVSQNRSGPEMELVRKASDAGCPTPVTPNSSKPLTEEETAQAQQAELELNCRQFLARSLCRSVQWEARGGKSGSRFCKTVDDRFVLKEMKRSEIGKFEIFAPNYFDYIDKCQQQNQPTLLTKIFGVYTVSIKKKDSFQEKTLIVMENLFYDCDIKNKFDLKGSERNRLVDPANQNGEIVLLDENFVQMSWSKPLYILSHSKAVLKDAINRDSSFLAKNRVMDYSLLVGLDDTNGLLVLGIIDYIRTFTLDKLFESFVKTGLGGKLPTVIAPERYKLRFIDAMDRYFYTVPDRWEGLSKI